MRSTGEIPEETTEIFVNVGVLLFVITVYRLFSKVCAVTTG